MPKSFSQFQDGLTSEQLGLFLYLDKLFTEIEGVTRKMRYGVPFYDYGQWICYINPRPKEKAELCFLDGNKLISHYPILQTKDRKRVAGLTLDANQDIDIELILSIFDTAILLVKPT